MRRISARCNEQAKWPQPVLLGQLADGSGGDHGIRDKDKVLYKRDNVVLARLAASDAEFEVMLRFAC